jgi:hypothetical protein
MAAVKLKVAYADGRKCEIIASPRAQVMTERYFGGVTAERAVEAAYYLAWASLNKAGQEPADFETWLDLVEEVEESAAKDPDPTLPAQSPDTSFS